MRYLFFSLFTLAFVLNAQGQQPFVATYDHSALSVSNLERSGNFYKEILFLEEIATPADNPILRWFSLGGNTQLHLIKSDDTDIKTTKAIHLSLRISDFDKLLTHLKEAEIPYTNWPGDSSTPSVRPDGVRQVYIQDPDGYWIELNDAAY